MWQSIFKGVIAVGRWCIGHQEILDAAIGAISQVAAAQNAKAREKQ